MTSCAALLSAYFAGAQIADLDKTRVYEIPSSIMAKMTTVERGVAKACALRYGVKYKVVEPMMAQSPGWV